MNLYGPKKVGGDILAHCGKCKRELAHVIMAMVGTKPARVICKTCKSEHNYRSGERTVSKVPREPRATRTFVKNSEYWEQKMATKKQAPMRAYKTQELFKLGDVISHSKFGLGIVEEVKTNGKIVVLFRDEERVLVHGLGS
ncbi:hypothetical protein EBT16_04430 [bacterium]|nr:hypothetical protein [bacterium]